MEMDGGRIHFVCIATGHDALGGDRHTITIHDGEWAYCGSDRRDHRWSPTGGVAIEEAARIRRGMTVSEQVAV